MSVTEQVLLMPCEGERLVGVLAQPAPGAARHDLGLVIVVGGPQVRIGSHRQFVQLARALAAAGWPVLRFDVRGMGDSSGTPRTFEHITPDIAAAIDALCAQAGVTRAVLWGLCDGASAALLYVQERQDPRVAGLCLLNPWVRSEATLARTHVKHYYRQRLMQPAFWRKMMQPAALAAALRGLAVTLRSARLSRADAPLSFQARMALGWRRFEGPVLLALSGQDYTAREFEEQLNAGGPWAGATARTGFTQVRHVHADHTLSQREARMEHEDAVRDWLCTAERAPALRA